MARSSKQQAAENRQTVVETASKLFRAQGFEATSVPEIMQAAGLTHGAFYGQFASKEALASEAVDSAFAWLEGWLNDVASEASSANPLTVLAERYLTPQHRDNPSLGCPVAALAGDVAREPPDSPVRAKFAGGIETVVQQLRDNGVEADAQRALADYATLIGALLIARATTGRPISDQVLAAARTRLTS